MTKMGERRRKIRGKRRKRRESRTKVMGHEGEITVQYEDEEFERKEKEREMKEEEEIKRKWGGGR